uniref:Uncharacterized protein n=1 Tax=Globodera rostochiensis TaxID=31243 RepID=A0A914I3L9_GLORO
MGNKSGATICCGFISVETGTLGVSIVLCVLFGLYTIYFAFDEKQIVQGMITGVFACACLLVIYGQHARNQWLFVPCLILGVAVVGVFGYEIYEKAKCLADGNDSANFAEFLSSAKGCMRGLIIPVLLCVVTGWPYYVILRGFLAVRNG